MRDWPELWQKRNAERKRFLFAEGQLTLTLWTLSPNGRDTHRLMENARKTHASTRQTRHQLAFTSEEERRTDKLLTDLEAPRCLRWLPECAAGSSAAKPPPRRSLRRQMIARLPRTGQPLLSEHMSSRTRDFKLCYIPAADLPLASTSVPGNTSTNKELEA